MMELRVGAQYWNTSAKSPESSCQSGALRQRRLRARTVPIEVNALGHQRIGVRRDHVGVMPAHVVPAEVIDDEELVRGAGIRQQSGPRSGARRERGTLEHRAHHDVGLGAEAVARRSASGQVEGRGR